MNHSPVDAAIHGEVGLTVAIVVGRHGHVAERRRAPGRAASACRWTSAGRTTHRSNRDTRRCPLHRRRRNRRAPADRRVTARPSSAARRAVRRTPDEPLAGGLPIDGDIGPAVAIVVRWDRTVPQRGDHPTRCSGANRPTDRRMSHAAVELRYTAASAMPSRRNPSPWSPSVCARKKSPIGGTPARHLL